MVASRLVSLEGSLCLRVPAEMTPIGGFTAGIISTEIMNLLTYYAVGIEKNSTAGLRPGRKKHAAVLLDPTGLVFAGVNRRDKFPGNCSCAECAAIGALRSYGRSSAAMVVVHSSDYAPTEAPTPCETCRGVLADYMHEGEMLIVGANSHGHKELTNLSDFVYEGYAMRSRKRKGDQNGSRPLFKFQKNRVRFKVNSEAMKQLKKGVLPKALKAELESRLAAMVKRSTYFGLTEDVTAQATVVVSEQGLAYMGVNMKHPNPPASFSALNVALGNAVTDGASKVVMAMSYLHGNKTPSPIEAFPDLHRLLAHCPNPERTLCVCDGKQKPLSELLATKW